MGAGVYIKFEPDLKIIGNRFGAMARGFRTFRVPLTASVRTVLIPSVTQNFLEGGRPPWEPLSEATLRRRDREGTLGGMSNDILVETGSLFGAATALARWTIGPQFATYSNLPAYAWYGELHQFGDDKHNVKFPARPFAVMQDEDEREVFLIFQKWTSGIVVSNWGARIRRL